MMEDQSLLSLQARLDAYYCWPSLYPFKFIAPREKAGELTVLFGVAPVKTRFSKNARYVSLTAEIEMASSEEVISLYRQALQIEGVLAL